MQRLAASLLALTCASPPQAGRDAFQRTTFDLSEFARRCIHPLNVLAQQKRQRVSAKLAGPLWVQVDQTRVSQALRYLVRGAIEHCSAGSDIQIETCRDADEALILVTGNGPGIIDQDQSGVLGHFERHSRESQRRRQSGSIRLHRVPAGGCLFEFALPLTASPCATSARAGSVSPLARGNSGRL